MSFTPFRIPIVPQLKKNMILSIIEKGLRIDERKLEDIRPIKIITGYLDKAEGSAYVELGKTKVIAGVKVEVGEPFRDMPDLGVLTVHAEFVPLASPSFEPGPPDENAIELSRVIDRSFRELGAVELEKLAIIPGKKVWIVWVDLYIIDHDGNLLDASMLAALTALKMAMIPGYTIEGDNVVIDRESSSGVLPLKEEAVYVHIAKIGNYLVVDPSLDEEVVADSRIAFSISRNGRIAGIQKMGQGGMSIEEITKAMELAISVAPKYFNAVDSVLNKEENKG
ncbi:MAG: exosome complex protein Rrp42 [Desulfurococcales archaeon]|nr:exosome complex protein Rrp42 [Desulfurococcales archaeon]